MKFKVDFSGLEKLAKIMNPEGVDFRIDSKEHEIEIFEKTLKEKGIEINPEDLDSGTPVHSYKGRQVLLYIKDHGNRFDAAMMNGVDGKRFHITHCKVLEDMHRRNRFQRYVVTNRLDGNFVISDSGGWGRPAREGVAQLRVCMVCLKKLNYRGAVSDGQLNTVFKTFSLKDFFSAYSTCFRYMPKAFSDAAKVGYTEDWDVLSRRLRERKGYGCQKCHVKLVTHKHLCDVHHVNGVKSDNSPDNLQVLCRDCHRKQPMHEGIFISASDMQVLQALREKQGLLVVSCWNNDAYDLSDTSIHGDMAILQNKGYPPPVIGFDVADEKGAVVANLEAAWPDRRIGITLTKLNISGWKIYQVGEICGGLE